MPILGKCFPCISLNSEEEKVITKLDFTNLNLSEQEFPLVWQHERTLDELILSSTRISSLPPQLFYCQILRSLDLSNNNLDNIPSAIGTLRHLQQLNLSKNFISSLPDNLKNCRYLTHLDLSCNHLQRLPEPITCLLTLQELFLNETYLEFLPANFGRLTNLRILELRLNSLITLPKSMGRLSNLQRIDIGGNEFTELPEVVGNLCKLRELWIDFNQIRRITHIGKLQELQHFEANGNLIEILPNELGNWHRVEVLSISTNALKSFPNTIGMLRALVTLKCEFCEIEELPNSISKLENLEELVISHNRLNKVPTSIGMLRKLRFLFADDNKLQSLPEELCSCAALSVLSVSRNQLVDLPDDIGRLINLKVINIVDNAIATLPVSVLNLVNLTSMWISDNQTQPLVPLQFADGAAKTRLTCFMLPQTGVSGQFMPDSANSEAYMPSASFNPIGNASCQVLPINRPDQANMMSTSTKKALTRSIGFVEDAINKATSNISDSDYLKDAVSTHSNTDDEQLQYGPRLMRSPTPYPKELRLMAKYMRTGQKVAEKPPHVREVKEARVIANSTETDQLLSSSISNNCPLEIDNRLQPAFYQINELENHNGFGQQSYIGLVPQNEQEIITCQNERGDYFLVRTIQAYDTANELTPQVTFLTAAGSDASMPNSNLYTYYSTGPQISAPEMYEHSTEIIDQTVLQHQQHQEQQQQQQHHLQQQQQQQFISPPPYHIARNFTKKTPQDLSNYETMRKHQTLMVQTEIPNSQTANINLNAENYNNQATNIEQPEITFHSQQNDYDNQNNLINDKETVTASDVEQHQNSTTLTNIQQQQQVPPNVQLCTTDGATRLSNKKKTPWLFGMHKNPTVKQVTIKCDKNETGFAIGNIDNEEGIFVLSIDSNSSVSRLLSIHDKLLEVNGHDFTNATLEEAKHILLRAGGLISIMLSRK